MTPSLRSLSPLALTLRPSSKRRFAPAIVGAIAALASVFAVASACGSARNTLPSAATASPKRALTGHVVRWNRPEVTLSVASAMKSVAPDPVVSVAGALAAWVGAHPALPALRVTAVAGEGPAIGPDGVNVVRMAPDDFTMPKHALAVTLVTFSADSGEIFDADMLIDARGHELAELDEGADQHGAYDVQSLLTHEMGHVLGLGEDYDDEHATMYALASPGDTSKRVLTAPDRAALRPLYDPAPATAPTTGGCSSTNESAGVLGGLVIAAILAASRRARRASVSLALAWLLFGEPSSSASTDDAYVAATTTEWRGGAMVTTLALRDAAGGTLGTVTTLGGAVGPLSQVASGAPVPSSGARVSRAALRRSAIGERAQ